MNPILAFLRNRLVSQRILGKDVNLNPLERADTLLQQLIQGNKVPGLAITVLKKGKTFFQKGYGFADLEGKTVVHPQRTIFRIASVSKPISATALACMVQDGIIDIDASFYTYVPYYPKKRWDFTLRQLAGHTAGIRGYKGKEYGLNEPYGIKESLVVFQEDPLLFEPGNGYLYNSFDWVLISLAMQEASGILFEEYVQERVLNPLEMTNTFVPNCIPEGRQRLGAAKNGDVFALTKQEDTATFYSRGASGFRKAIPVNNCYKLAGGGYLSTSADVAKLGQAYLDNKLVQEEIRNQFLTSQAINGNPTQYGLGWQVSQDAKGRVFYGHVGNGVGGYTNFFVYPEEELVFSILVNCTDPKVQDKLDAVIACFF